MKVICAGAAKTGTKSLARALRILGYETVFDVEEAIEFAFCEWEDVWDGKRPNLDHMFDEVYSKVDAVVDLPHSYFFDEFLERWPKAKVVLMVRDPDEWIQSYRTMVSRAQRDYAFLWPFYLISPSMRRLIKWYYRLSTTTLGNVNPHEFLYKTWLRRHNSYVRATVPEKQLLEFNVTQGWEPLCEFLGKEVPNVPFPNENQARDPYNITDRMMQDTWIAKKMMLEIKLVCAGFAVVLLFGIAYAFS